MHDIARGWGTECEHLTEWLVIRLFTHGDEREAEPPLAEGLFGIAEAADRFRVIIEPDGNVAFRSYFVGQLITLHKRLHRKGGALRLAGVTAANYDVIRLMRLTDQLPAFPNRDAALQRY